MSDWFLQVAPRLGRGYLRVLGATTRYREEGADRVAELRSRDGPVLGAFWHNRLLGPLIPYRDQNIGVVISRSRDGELVSRVAAGFGYLPLRGSSSRGGTQAIRAVLRHLGRGFDVVLTPDGPKGPRYTVQPGLVQLARRTGRPVIPVGVGISRKVVFSSWDRFQLPLPFGKIHLVFGEPLFVGADVRDEDASEAIRTSLLAVTERADRSAGAQPP